MKFNSPKELKKEIDKYVIGQDETKKILCTQLFLQKLKKERFENDCSLKKSMEFIKKNNILLTGPTGCGKTYILEIFSKLLDLPLAIVDATTLTESGYVGDDVRNILHKLLQKTDFDIYDAETGIIYLDEIDKIGRKGENPSITRDVSGEGVQNELLKIIEGTEVNVSVNGGRYHPSQNTMSVNTKEILFIGGGSFEGIEKIVETKLNTSNSIGFGNYQQKQTIENIRQYISKEDLRKFGMLPELLGRFPLICNLNYLEKDDYRKILYAKKGLIEQYKIMFKKLFNIDFKISNKTINEIVDKCLEEKVGARGLQQHLSYIVNDIIFNLNISKDSTKIVA